MAHSIRPLDLLVVVNLDIHIWTARRKLSPADLGGAPLPPEDLASLGSKRICNPENLRTFGTLKARAVNLLDRHGIRFLSGWAIPQARMGAIARELAVIRDAFMESREVFLQRYDEAVGEWIAQHPQWGDIIANSTVSEEYVRSRMDFRWQMYQVRQPDRVAPAKAVDDLEKDINALGDTLFAEVAKAAAETWTRCYVGKTEITRKALSPLKSIQEKLLGLTFVDPRAAPVAELIETAFRTIPRRGAITGSMLLMLQGLVLLLQNPKSLPEHGQMILDGRKNLHSIVESLGMTKCPEQDDTGKIPEKTVAQSLPVIASHGLW